MTDDKTFDEILREEQVKLRQEELDTQDRLKKERESVLRRSAALCYEALHQRFSAPDLTIESDFNSANTCIAQATAVLKGEQATADMPPASAQPTTALPFDYASLSDSQRQIIDMVVADRSRFKLETFGEKVVVKDNHYTQARKDSQASQAAGSGDGNTSSPAAKKAASAPAKKATTPAPAEVPSEPVSPSPQEASPSSEAPKSFIEKAKAAVKSGMENAKQ